MTLLDVLYYLIPIGAVIYGLLYLNNRSQPTHHIPEQPTSKRTSEPASDSRVFTLAELAKYDGADPKSAVLVGCKGLVFDMTSGNGSGEAFYGPGGPYAAFAGHDASRSLAKMDVSYTSAEIRDLSPAELNVLDEWYDKYQSKYTVVGKIIDHSEPNSGVPPGNGWPELVKPATTTPATTNTSTNTATTSTINNANTSA